MQSKRFPFARIAHARKNRNTNLLDKQTCQGVRQPAQQPRSRYDDDFTSNLIISLRLRRAGLKTESIFVRIGMQR